MSPMKLHLTVGSKKRSSSLAGWDIFISNVTTRVHSKGIERWRETFNVDLLQHITGTELALPHLKNSDSGAIVYVASIASVMTANMPSETEYGTMKAALISYGTQLANRVGRDGIRVNLVSPGPIYHEGGFWQMVEQKNPDLFKMAEKVSVFRRFRHRPRGRQFSRLFSQPGRFEHHGR